MRTSTIAVSLLLAGLTGSQVSAATKVVLLYTGVSPFAGSFVAKDQGFFDQHGLDVDLSLAQNGSVISAVLVANSAQIGGPTPSVLLQADEQGLDLVIVAGTSVFPVAPGSNGVVARSASGIKDAHDLIGKKVGVPGLGALIDVMTKKWVESNGVDYHKVDWVELQFPQMNDALKSGLVDAVATTNPFHRRILDSNTGYDIGDYSAAIPSGTMTAVYASTREWATKNADAIEAFRASLDEAVAYIIDPTHAESVRTSIAKYTKLPPQAAATIDMPINFAVHAVPEGMKFWVEVAREQGLIKDNPDPALLIAP